MLIYKFRKYSVQWQNSYCYFLLASCCQVEITCSLRKSLAIKLYVNTPRFCSCIFPVLVVGRHSAKHRTLLLKQKIHVSEALHLGRLFKIFLI